jgi:hypothetical protein
VVRPINSKALNFIPDSFSAETNMNTAVVERSRGSANQGYSDRSVRPEGARFMVVPNGADYLASEPVPRIQDREDIASVCIGSLGVPIEGVIGLVEQDGGLC